MATAPIVITRPKSRPSGTAQVDKLDKQHPYYQNLRDVWSAVDLLYRGGYAIQKEWARFLVKRPKEISEVWLSRGQKFNYENHLGTGLGWYRSTLFKKDPELHFRLADGSAEAPESQTDYYTRWVENVDRAGTTYVDLWRDLFITMAVFREAYCCVDLPHADDPPLTLAAQKASGGLDPYLMVYDPRSVINWAVDDFGNYEWILIKAERSNQDFLGDQTTVDRWYYYDRTEYRIYERKTTMQSDAGNVLMYGSDGRPMTSAINQTANLIDSGPHALADQGRVPVRHFEIPEGLWLANRAYLPAVALINLENSYEWSLFMSNLAVPVIKSESEKIQTMTESGALLLQPGDSFEFAEAKGTSYAHSAACCSAKREEMFRQMYLMAQGRSSSASASAQSGYSKEMDLMPAKDVLSEFGDIVRAGMQAELVDVIAVRGDDTKLQPDVRGFNFEMSTELQEAEVLEIEMSIDVPSDTFYKEKYKRLTMAAHPDANPDVLAKMFAEIEAAPSRSELAAQQQQMQQLTFARGIERAVTSTGQNAEAAGNSQQ